MFFPTLIQSRSGSDARLVHSVTVLTFWKRRLGIVTLLQLVFGMRGLRWWMWWKPMLPVSHCRIRGSL